MADFKYNDQINRDAILNLLTDGEVAKSAMLKPGRVCRKAMNIWISNILITVLEKNYRTIRTLISGTYVRSTMRFVANASVFLWQADGYGNDQSMCNCYLHDPQPG